jgi:hypothetical protein
MRPKGATSIEVATDYPFLFFVLVPAVEISSTGLHKA